MLPIAHRTLLACRDTLAAGLSTRRSGCAETVAPLAPTGVTCRSWEGHPHIVEPLDTAPIARVHEEAIALAWHDGAWDIRVLRHPPLAGAELGMIYANRICAAPALMAALTSAAERGALVTWDWRPLRNGAPIRRAAHAAKDKTLRLDCGRSGPPPATAPIDWRRRGGMQKTIRLGEWSDEYRPAPKPPRVGPAARATGAQRSYIVALRRATSGGIGDPLPASLTRADASAMIDALLARQP